MSVAKQNLKAALFLAKKLSEAREENARLQKLVNSMSVQGGLYLRGLAAMRRTLKKYADDGNWHINSRSVCYWTGEPPDGSQYAKDALAQDASATLANMHEDE